jgi:rhodanese-related sulfurtransferase
MGASANCEIEAVSVPAERPVAGVEHILARAAERAAHAGVGYAGLVLPTEAFELAQAGAVLVDVRTRAEWELVGRVPGSVLVEWQRYPHGAANLGFFAELDVHASHEDIVLFLCRSARRSHLAAEAAAVRGYSRAFNILEGFEGDLDPLRRRGTLGGWRSAGLPWVQS